MTGETQIIDALSRKEAMAALREGTGRGVKVAVLDSGIETSHPDLKGLVLHDDIVIEDDGMFPCARQSDGSDVYGHGTAIASILKRTAPEITLGSFRVLGGRLRSRTPIISAGVSEAAALGYQILNCSFGCRGDPRFVMPYKEIVDLCYLRNIHLVAGCNNNDYTRVEWPGHFPTVITVNMARACDAGAFYYRPGRLVEFAASGEDVSVSWMDGTRKQVTGSSYAAPVVAGMAARILSVHPGLSTLALKETLRRIANPWHPDLGSINDNVRQ